MATQRAPQLTIPLSKNAAASPDRGNSKRVYLRNSLLLLAVVSLIALLIFAYSITTKTKQLHGFSHRAQQAVALQDIARLLAKRRGLQAVVDSGNTAPETELKQLNQMLTYSLRPLIHDTNHLEGNFYQHASKLRGCLAIDCFNRSTSEGEQAFKSHTVFAGNLLMDARQLLTPGSNESWLKRDAHLNDTVELLIQAADFAEATGQFRGRYAAHLAGDSVLDGDVLPSALKQMRDQAPDFFRLSQADVVMQLGLGSYLERTEHHFMQLDQQIHRLNRNNESINAVEFFYGMTQLVEDLHFFRHQVYQHLISHTSSQIDQHNEQLLNTGIAGVLLLLLISALFLLHYRSEHIKTKERNLQLGFIKAALDEHAIVSVTDAKGDIVSMNSRFNEISGYSPEELIGRNHRIINSGLHGRSFFKTLWDSVHQNKVWSGEVCNRRKNGELYWVYATVLPLYNDDNQLVSIISVRTDITEQKHAEELLRQEKENADAANRAKSDFLANMSHEIRTPMNAVIGMTHLALKSAGDDKTLNYLKKIKLSAHNLLDIINDILDFSKIEAGKIQLENIAFPLRETLQQAVEVSQVRAQEKGLNIELSLPSDLPQEVISDPLRLSQILLNLLSNAVKFTEKGFVRLSVCSRSVGTDETELRFSVQDSGIGISKEKQAHLFEAFSQEDTSTTRVYGGTGLGLSISQQLCQLLGGQLRVDSEPGEGSCFSFSLRLKTAQTVSKKRPLNELRALYIDDDPISLAAVKRLFHAQGIELQCSDDPATALNYIIDHAANPDHQLDLILVDHLMDGVDGIRFTRELRENIPPQQHPLVILLTGQDKHQLSKLKQEKLFDSIWLKPVSASEILDSLQTVLRNRQRGFSATLNQPVEEVSIRQILGAKVLVAEDNEINQEVITGLLEPYGLEVSVVENGQQAIEAVKTQAFDLVLMDLQMPVMGGLDATRAILDLGLAKQPPIIAMTANAMESDRQDCLKAGMSDHISKPIDPSRLQASLYQWLPKDSLNLPQAPATEASREQDLSPCFIEGINMAVALSSASQDPALLRRLFESFVNQYQDFNIWHCSDETRSRELHTLKGLAATLGMSELTLLASALEQEDKKNYPLKDADLQLLNDEIAQLIQRIQACMKKHMTGEPTQPEPQEEALADPAAELKNRMNQINTVDHEAVNRLMDQLEHQLAEGDSDALDSALQLMLLLQESPFVQSAAEVLELAESFDFDRALAVLQRIPR